LVLGVPAPVKTRGEGPAKRPKDPAAI